MTCYLSTFSSIQTLPVDEIIVNAARCAPIPISVRFTYGEIVRPGVSKWVT